MRGGRAALAALVATASVFLLVAAGSAGADASKSIYIVQMLDAPAVSYSGGTAGLKATKPAKGEKIDPADAAVKAYVDYLHGQHDKAIQKVGGGGGDKLYDFDYTYDGFAARLTVEQAAALEKQSGVVNVAKNELVSVDTATTPTFLGLTDPGGLWDQLGGPEALKDGRGAGEDMIIGDVDSGIWPESKSFSDRDSGGKLIYQPINTSKWHGKKCAEGEAWDTDRCNKKLIGARFFNAAWGGSEALEAARPWEFMSPRDYNGHGTHTASTAGGNHGVLPTGPGAGLGRISGMAPRARIAVYKALWSTQDASTASGFTADLVAAIDQAVADGVDVINYSISGTSTNFLDPVEVAFLFAEDAGVFVSESAGNSGPATATVAHPGPWTTTVAAGTHNRNGIGSVTLGNGTTISGASIASAVGPAPLIDSTAAAVSGADPTKAALCYAKADNGGNAVLDPAKVAGKIVLCDRGVNARVNKSLAVKEAGGVGMILANTSPNSLNADFHFVPTVHISDTDRPTVKAYLASAASPTATINQSTITTTDPAPFTASFSSRGPLIAGGGDLLKPDVIAPGQDILAAVAPPGQAGLEFNLLSGTSMSAPHVSGVAALLEQLHPGWTPMAIKSALMTSAYDVLDGGISNATRIFRQGAGHIKPNSAADPGLVYDAGFNDFLAFLCGTTTGVSPSTCTALKNAGFSTDPSNFNSPSIAIGDLAGVQTVTRKVRNVGNAAATYTASVSGLSGISAVVSPSSLSLNAGQTGSFTVTFTTAGATLNSYTGGYLTWTAGSHTVRSPIVIRPVALAAPAEVSGNGGPINYDVTFGFTGPFGADARGLVPATTNTGTVADDPHDSFSPTGDGVVSFPVTIAAGTTVARFQLFAEDASSGSDLDLYVFKGTTQVGSSTGGTAAEQVTLRDPAPGTDYTVYIHGFATAGGAPSPFKLYTWLLGNTSAGNMTVSTPASATIGGTGTVNLTFAGLAAGTKYLGSVAYTGTASATSPTIVRVDTP